MAKLVGLSEGVFQSLLGGVRIDKVLGFMFPLATAGVFLVGTRNPLALIGFDAGGAPLQVIWAGLLALFIIFSAASQDKGDGESRGLRLAPDILAIGAFMTVMVLFGLINSQDHSSGNLESHVATLVLFIAIVAGHKFFSPSRQTLLWSGLVCFSLTGAILALVNGPVGLEQHFEAFSVGRIQFGRYMGIGAMVAFFFAAYASQKIRRIPLSLVGTFLAGMMVLSGSRGVVLSFLLTFLFAGALSRFRRVVFASAAVGVLVLFVLAVIPDGPRIIARRYLEVGLLYPSARPAIWSSEFWNIASNPNILIYGSARDPSIHAHNIFFETLLQAGIVALFSLVAVVWLGLKSMLSATLIEPLVGLPLMIFTFLLFSAQLSGSFVDNSFMWFFLFLGVVQASRFHKPSLSSLSEGEQGPRTRILPTVD